MTAQAYIRKVVCRKGGSIHHKFHLLGSHLCIHLLDIAIFTVQPTMSDADENDLFNIQISDSEDDKAEKKSKRTGQSEDDFKAVKNTYHAKVENGNVRHS